MKMPPPALANPGPYEAVDGVVTTHPWLELAANEQSVLLTNVDDWTGLCCVQPGSVWSDIWFIVTWLTPSKVSISPPVGQFGAWDHHACTWSISEPSQRVTSWTNYRPYWTAKWNMAVKNISRRLRCRGQDLHHISDPNASHSVSVRSIDSHSVTFVIERNNCGVVHFHDGMLSIGINICELVIRVIRSRYEAVRYFSDPR